MRLRTARPDDLPALDALITDSARGLSRGYYTPEQVESLPQYVFGADTQLIADGTYYVCEDAGTLAAAGGWSRRRTLYGGDRLKGAEDLLLDPGSEPEQHVDHRDPPGDSWASVALARTGVQVEQDPSHRAPHATAEPGRRTSCQTGRCAAARVDRGRRARRGPAAPARL
jgi:hypothetical protein